MREAPFRRGARGRARDGPRRRPGSRRPDRRGFHRPRPPRARLRRTRPGRSGNHQRRRGPGLAEDAERRESDVFRNARRSRPLERVERASRVCRRDGARGRRDERDALVKGRDRKRPRGARLRPRRSGGRLDGVLRSPARWRRARRTASSPPNRFPRRSFRTCCGPRTASTAPTRASAPRRPRSTGRKSTCTSAAPTARFSGTPKRTSSGSSARTTCAASPAACATARTTSPSSPRSRLST